MGLNESFAQIRAQILLMNSLPLIDQVFSLVAQEEHQRTINNMTASVDSIGLLAPAEYPRRAAPSNTYDRYRRKKSQRPICTHCGAKGHIIERCYKLHGFPPGYRQGNYTLANKGKTMAESGAKGSQNAFLEILTTEQYSQLVTMLQPNLQSPKTNIEESGATTGTTHVAGTCYNNFVKAYDSWVIDSCATIHICYNWTLFHDIQPTYNIYIVFPTQSCFMVEYIGSVKLSSDIVLTEVLYVPTFTYKLLSVSALMRCSHYSINFCGKTCSIKDKSGLKIIGKVEVNDGLYLLQVPSLCLKETATLMCKTDLDTWHQRMGHPSTSRLLSMKSLLNFRDNSFKHDHCVFAL